MLIVRDGLLRTYQLHIGSGDVFLTNNDTGLPGPDAPTASLDTSVSRRYRVDIVGPSATLFVDGEPLLTCPAGVPQQTNSPNLIAFGDFTTGAGSTTRLKEISATRLFVSDFASSTTICPEGSCEFEAVMGGVGPLTRRWQVEAAPAGSNQWTALGDGPVLYDGTPVGTVSGTSTSRLRYQNNPSHRGAIRVRCVVTGACGLVATRPAVIAVCAADFSCDGFVDAFDYDEFVLAFETGTDRADFNGDGFADAFDYDDYVTAFETGC